MIVAKSKVEEDIEFNVLIIKKIGKAMNRSAKKIYARYFQIRTTYFSVDELSQAVVLIRQFMSVN